MIKNIKSTDNNNNNEFVTSSHTVMLYIQCKREWHGSTDNLLSYHRNQIPAKHIGNVWMCLCVLY